MGSESPCVWAEEWPRQVVSGTGAAGQASEGLVASCELQEEVLVQLLPAGALPCRQENVAPYVLVHHTAACRHAAESHVDVFIKLDGHLQGGGRGADGGGMQAQPLPCPGWVWPSPLSVPSPHSGPT